MLRYSGIEVLKRVVGAQDFPGDCLIDCDGVPLGLEAVISAERLRDCGQ